MKKLNWIQISDIHYNFENYDTMLMRGRTIEYIKSLKTSFDFIIISGDIKYQSNTYTDDIVEFINCLSNELTIDKNNIFIVPGNHDIKRTKMRTTFIEGIFSSDNPSEEINTIDEESYNFLLTGQDDFFEFYKKVKNEDFKKEGLHFVKKRDGYNIVHINTCLVSGVDREDEEKKLIIGQKKLREALNGIDKDTFNIAIGHHSIECLNLIEKQRFENTLSDFKVDMYLSGHVHKPNTTFDNNNINDTIFVSCGSGMCDDFSTVGIVTGNLDIETGKGEIAFHKWSQSLEKWIKDNEVSRSSVDNTISFNIKGKGKIELDQRNKLNNNLDNGKCMLNELANNIRKKFVKTEFYKNALNGVKSNKIVLISGFSKMGKTTTSIMIADELAKDYDIVYGKSMRYILNNIKNNPQRKEIIVIDDFLGQATLVDIKVLEELDEILQKIVDLPNKKLILNSRKTILNDLKIQNSGISKFLEYHAVNVETNFENNDRDRLSILLMYIKVNNLQNEYVQVIYEKELLNKILLHKNFNPLAIDYATKLQSNIKLEDYKEHFIRVLDNQDYIWQKELGALKESARMYLYILYSLTNVSIDKSIVDKCFSEIVNNDPDTYGDESLENISKYLIGTLIRQEKSNDKNIKISVHHPSLNEYILKILTEREKLKIIDSAIYMEQLERFEKGSYAQKKLKELIYSPEVFFSKETIKIEIGLENSDSIYITKPIHIYYLKYIAEFNIKDKTLETIIIYALETIISSTNLIVLTEYLEIIIKIISFDFYDISKITLNKDYMNVLLRTSNGEHFWSLINIIYKKDINGLDFLKFTEDIQEEVCLKLDEAIYEAFTNFIESKIDDFIPDSDELGDEDEIWNLVCDIYNDIVEQYRTSLEDIAEKIIEEEIRKQKLYNMPKIDSDIDRIISEDSYIQDLIEEKLNNL